MIQNEIQKIMFKDMMREALYAYEKSDFKNENYTTEDLLDTIIKICDFDKKSIINSTKEEMLLRLLIEVINANIKIIIENELIK
jgi:hypothetical protein